MFEACKIKSKSQGALHKPLEKFWVSSTEHFYLQAKRNLHFSDLKKLATYLTNTHTQNQRNSYLSQFIKVVKEGVGAERFCAIGRIRDPTEARYFVPGQSRAGSQPGRAPSEKIHTWKGSENTF